MKDAYMKIYGIRRCKYNTTSRNESKNCKSFFRFRKINNVEIRTELENKQIKNKIPNIGKNGKKSCYERKEIDTKRQY